MSYSLFTCKKSSFTEMHEFYKIFHDNNQTFIHRQSTALHSHGLTGLSSWPVSICLGDYLMKRKHLLDKK